MTTRYQETYYEDVAQLLNKHHSSPSLCFDFADRFAADDPPLCLPCGVPHSRFHASEGLHEYKGGFDRKRFLAACGLEAS